MLIQKIGGWIVVLILAFGIGFGSGLMAISSNEYIQKKVYEITVKPVQPMEQSTNVKIVYPDPPSVQNAKTRWLVFGDIFFGRYIDDWSKNSAEKFAYPFRNLGSFEREKYDAWLAGLECPVTNNTVSSARQELLLEFNCRPEFLPEIKKYFTAFSLANNHIDNQQKEVGLKETREHLTDNGFQFFGHYDSVVTTDLCEVVSLPVRIEYEKISANIPKDIYSLPEKGEIPVALCGYHNVFKLPASQQMDVVKEYAMYFPTFVFPHQGSEYGTRSDELQRSISHGFVDRGADGVFGSHTHSIHESEFYKGKLIQYSLGNSIFDQQFNNEVTTGAVIDADISLTGENLNDWLDLASSCKAFQDTCLQAAQQKKLKKVDIQIEYGVLAIDGANKQWIKAGPEKQQMVEKRTGLPAGNK